MSKNTSFLRALFFLLAVTLVLSPTLFTAIAESDPAYSLQPGDVFSEGGIYYRVIEPGGEDPQGTVEVIANPTGYTGTIIIPESAAYDKMLFRVVGIGANAFRNSLITGINLPDSIETIGHSAFDYSRISSIVIPPKVTALPQYSLYANFITEITLPAALVSFHHEAFGQGVLQFSVEKGNPVFAASGGVLFSADMKTLLKYPTGRTETAYTVPDKIGRAHV